MIDPKGVLMQVICCPDCGGNLAERIEALRCESCGRSYDLTDGIANLLPSSSLADDRGQDSADYQRWLEIAAVLSKDYFENGNSLFNRIHHSSHRRIAAVQDRLGGGRRILDLSCGAGAHFPYHRHPENVVGLDIHRPSLEAVRKRYPSANVVQGDIYRMPFRDGSFDIVMSVYNLEHIFHLAEALANVQRLLTPDGTFLVGLPCEGGLLWNGGRALTSARSIPQRYGIDYDKVIAIEHCNTARQVLDALRQSFDVVELTYWPLPFLASIDLNLTLTAVCRPRVNRT